MNTISHHDPERPQIINFRKRRFDHLWMDGLILDNTYMHSLIIDGMTPAEAASALAEVRDEKARKRIVK